MLRIPKYKALSLLRQTIYEAKELQTGGALIFHKPKFEEWEQWVGLVKVNTAAIFGWDSPYVHEVVPLLDRVLQKKDAASRSRAGEAVVKMLRSFVVVVEESNPYEVTRQPATRRGAVSQHESRQAVHAGKDVFIVHGHDHGLMQIVAGFVQRLGLNPIILHEQASRGASLMEKLERHANVAFAVVLLTSDDIGCAAADKRAMKHRARQNVVLELGYFLAKLGRKKTCALVAEGVEIPSDYSGVVYVKIKDSDSWKYSLAKELQAAGLPIDISRVLG